MSHNAPVLFVSHGSPSMLIDHDPTPDFFKQLGQTLEKPKAILSVSAHWETEPVLVTANNEPELIYDFYGFPEELYTLTYPCPGSSELAERVKSLLTADSIDCKPDSVRGLDHGTWAPLKLMYSDADVPIVQLSLRANASPEFHYQLGQALQPLKEEGVLIFCSGSATHNIRGFHQYAIDAEPQAFVAEFDQWLTNNIISDEREDLLRYRELTPLGAENHPSEEHIMPLFVALGAAEQGQAGRQIHQGYTYSILSMSSFQWI